jgi:hypothetical protein
MTANTRAQDALRTPLNVESLEGRAMPAVGITHPTLATSALTTNLTITNENAVAAPQGVTASKVVSRIFVNGELVMKVQGRPQFTAIGPAASGDQNGQTETGGMTIFANGQEVGEFQGAPKVTRAVSYTMNGQGQEVKIVSYHITATPYLPPVGNSTVFGGPYVG